MSRFGAPAPDAAYVHGGVDVHVADDVIHCFFIIIYSTTPTETPSSRPCLKAEYRAADAAKKSGGIAVAFR